MEVPCCSGLPGIVKKGLEASGQKIPMDEIVISTRGKIFLTFYETVKPWLLKNLMMLDRLYQL